MTVLTTQEFKNQIFDFDKDTTWSFKGNLPTIVDFYADWCGPCRMLSPVLEKVSETYKGRVNIVKVDTEASPEVAAAFGIRGIPSLLFIPVNGQPAMSSGFMPEESFDTAISDLFGIKR